VKFCDKPRHQIFLEPEGLDTDEVYVNGLSMSLPAHVQKEIVQSIPGLENAEIVRNAYAIEYDCAQPTQLKHSLETKKIENLFLAGQINCTSGYEEAAAQGLMAGLNVIRKLRKQPPFILDRSEAYIGVLIDDLVTLGTAEPYRMFTARAEFRIVLRQDNADERLMKYGYEFGLISKTDYEQNVCANAQVLSAVEEIKTKRHAHSTLDRYLRRPEMDYPQLKAQKLIDQDLKLWQERKVEIEIKYEGYVVRQMEEIQRFKKLEKRQIPENTDYTKVRGISKEAVEKLTRVKPLSIGQASRIPGISSCDLSLLAITLQKAAS